MSTNAGPPSNDPLVSELGLPRTAQLLTTTKQMAILTTSSGHQVPISNTSCHANRQAFAQVLVVGRQASSCDLRIQHKSMSRQHAVLFYDNDSATGQKLFLMDLGGKHGTLVNGQRIAAKTPIALNPDDAIQFGNVRESVFTVQWVGDDDDSHAKDEGDEETTTTATTETLPPPQQQQMLETAGQGLTGRAKREAELAAMMDSLDQAPVYQKYKQKNNDDKETLDATTTLGAAEQNNATRAQPQTESENESYQQLQLMQQHQLPLSQTFDIPSDEDAQKRLPVTCLATDPSGARFAVGSRNQRLRLFDFAGLDRQRREPFHVATPDPGQPVTDVTYSNTGDRLWVGTGGAQPQVLAREGQDALVQTVRGDMYVLDASKTKGHTSTITAVAWHPLERDLALSASRDGTVRVRNVVHGTRQFEKLCSEYALVAKSVKGLKTPVTSLAVSPGGRELVLGTECGTLQRWNLVIPLAGKQASQQKAHRPQAVLSLSHHKSVTFVTYSPDGRYVACRAADDTSVHVYKSRFSASSSPLATCAGLPTLYEQASVAFVQVVRDSSSSGSGGGTYLVGGATARVASSGTNQPKTTMERGSLNVYDLTGALAQADSAATPLTTVLTPLLALETPVGPVRIVWHRSLNQLLVGNADGSVTVYCDAQLSKNGALLPLRKAGRKVDGLQELLQQRAPQGLDAIHGQQVVAPFASGPRKKRRKGDEPPPEYKLREPERPASGKHKAGGQGSGVTTLQQFLASSSQKSGGGADAVIAGKDPREALMKYAKPQDNAEKVLHTKTMEEEEEELAKREGSR